MARIPPSHAGNGVVLYLGMVTLSVAWLGLGRRIARSRVTRVAELWVVGAVWCAPLLAGPALFSRDVYSYLAQGTIMHLGLSPYHNAPIVLAHLGRPHVLAAVDPYWRQTTAPYGPLFLALVSVIVGVTGSNLIVGVVLVRLLELMGVVLLAIFLPRLARALGGDPARAIWLAVLSPLVLLELVAAAHNDALMVGLMVAGVTLVLERHPAVGIVVCTLAATIKIPAAAAVAFIALAWARTAPTPSAKLRVLAQAALLAATVVVAVGLVTGTGVGWVSTSAFSTPERVQLAITPATGLGRTIAAVLRDVGIPASSRDIESTLITVAFALTAVAGAALLCRVRLESMVKYLGMLLLAAAFFGPAAWPWYFTWGLALVAACPGTQRSRALAATATVAIFLVKANGVLALHVSAAPVVLAIYIVIASAAWYAWKHRRDGDRTVAGRAGDLTGGPSALAES